MKILLLYFCWYKIFSFKRLCYYNIKGLEVKLFQFKLFKNAYDSSFNNFISIKFEVKSSFENIVNHFKVGLSTQDIEYQKQIFGKCDLDIQIDSTFKLIINEVTDPFYIFQIFSVVLWCTESYYTYAGVIVFVTLISLGFSVYETRSNLVNIQQMAKYSCVVVVYRKNNVKY